MAGIWRCFTAKVKKKFRVTNNEKVICSVIGFLASQEINLNTPEEHGTIQPTMARQITAPMLLTEAQLQNPVATLNVNGKIHKIYPGENMIGHNPSTCSILLQNEKVCNEHAVLKVTGDEHLITDLGGPKTVRVGKVKLKEKTPFSLVGGELLIFGDFCAKYIKCTRGEHEATCSSVQSLLKR
ncbi:unnamed protein product [Meganyctiphanes norvegica]|uniref:FHA domain-containing protein n=1 Tax=Meganyctiphanes norvegica TaxID=48144 RepID=A0AAV2SE99_MEGNR